MKGKRIDKWELVALLGRGGMGEVWQARHTILGRECAIKIMSSTIAQKQKDVARFVQEAQIASQLRHPNIAAVEDIGRTRDGRPFLVMELLRGDSVGTRLKRMGVFTPRMMASIIRPGCEALEYAHAAGVIHRDIKPGNLFIHVDGDREILKILDFGLARVVSLSSSGQRLTAPHDIVGTPKYMSPEQVLSKPDVDKRTDLWSLGVVAYKALTGRDPFTYDGNFVDMCAEVLRAEIMAPSVHRPELSLGIDQWMAKALERDKTKRFQSALEMAQAFEEAVAESEAFDDPTTLTPLRKVKTPKVATLPPQVSVKPAEVPHTGRMNTMELRMKTADVTGSLSPTPSSETLASLPSARWVPEPVEAQEAESAEAEPKPKTLPPKKLKTGGRNKERWVAYLVVGWLVFVTLAALLARLLRPHG